MPVEIVFPGEAAGRRGPLVILGLALIATIAVQGRDDYFLPTLTAFGLFAAAVVLIVMSLPTGHR